MRVMVIDDDTAMTDLVKIQLKSEDVIVDAVYSGEEGLRRITKIPPDIIIIDLLMPAMDGWETCKNIRKICQVPILILSALDDPALVAKALDAGADDYLVKPVSSSILNAYIQKLTRRSRSLSEHLQSVSV